MLKVQPLFVWYYFNEKIVKINFTFRGPGFLKDQKKNRMNKLSTLGKEGCRGMQLFQKQIRKQIGEIKGMLEQIHQFQKNMPKGSLVITQKAGIFYYRWQYLNENLKQVRKYISKKEMNQIKALAQKSYYEKAEPILQKNLILLEKLDKAYCYDGGKKIFEAMTEHRKSLVLPLQGTCEQRIQAWKQESYEPCRKYTEKLCYETNAGEYVRSKSEVIIANLLHMQAEKLLYKYERPLMLNDRGRDIVIYPDFTLINVQTGKITYWEHAGLMSKPEYASAFVWKHNLYYENNLRPGADVIFTYETEDHPLEIRVLKKVISNLLA